MTRSVVIAGSRTLRLSVDEVDAALRKLRWPRATEDERAWLADPDQWEEVVCGEANGADVAGKLWAMSRGKAVHSEPITDRDIKTFGSYVGPRMRNRRMAERAAAAVVLWDGRSGGSSDMVARMVARDKPVEVVPWKAPHGQRRPVAAASRSKASVARQQARDRLTRVEEMVCAGASYASIAQALQISERQVQQIVKSSARASVTR